MGKGTFNLLRKRSHSEVSQEQAQIRVLIVESENAGARAIKRALRRDPMFACDVDRVRRPREVADRLADADFDVVLIGPTHYETDEGMPADLKFGDLGPEVLILPLPMGNPSMVRGAADWMRTGCRMYCGTSRNASSWKPSFGRPRMPCVRKKSRLGWRLMPLMMPCLSATARAG